MLSPGAANWRITCMADLPSSLCFSISVFHSYSDIFSLILFKAEEHAEDHLRELEILRKKVPELQDENLKFRADGNHVRGF